MFTRDIFQRGSSRWHKVDDEFRLVNGPSVDSLGNESVVISWSMSEVCSGQVEYGTTTSFGSTTTEQAISGGYDTHSQTISGLVTDTTYYYRTKSTSSASVTVYSETLSFTTTGAVVPTSAGPRYDFYGGSSFPAFPTIGGSNILVPESVVNASDVATALANFLNNTTSVPDGSTVVFDRTEGGAGTVYDISHSVYINAANSSLRSNITLFGYNAKVVATQTSLSEANMPAFYFRLGGWSNLTIQGFEVQGANTGAASYACRNYGSEYGSAFTFQPGFDGATIEDCWMHDLLGDGVFVYNSSASNAYTGHTTPTDMTIQYNLISGTGRQGITPNQGNGYTIDKNIIEDTGLWVVDAEDTVEGSYRVLKNVTISDNIIRRWNWYIQGATAYFRSLPIAFVQRTNELDECSDITISGNTFQQGARGYGDPDAESAFAVSSPSGGYEPVIVFGAPWSATYPPVTVTNVTITGNTFDFDPDQQVSKASPAGQRGEAVILRNCVGTITVTDNDWHDKPIWFDNCATPTTSNNGSGAEYTT